MSWWKDIFRQCLYMSIFIIPIPIGAYTIHNGSSAAVALISYLALSVFIPLAYLRSRYARFGREERRISGIWYMVVWFLVRGGLFFGDKLWKSSGFWSFPTIGRDIVFSVFMYAELCFIMLAAYVCTQVFCGRKAEV